MNNYISFFEPRKFQVVYMPREADGEYSKLYLNISKQYLRFINSKNIIASGIAGFLFLKQIFYVAIGILIVFFILSRNKKWAKRLHLLIPVIVYSNMTEGEVKSFLKRNPQLSKQNTGEIISKSKIVERYVDNQSEDIMSKIGGSNNSQTLKELIATEKKQTKNDTGSKSIFDNYESVMDQFNKK